MDMSRVCRICLQDKPQMEMLSLVSSQTHLAGSAEETSYYLTDILSECTVYTFDLFDEMPNQVCMECNQCARSAFEFKRRCIDSYRTLIKLKLNKEKTATAIKTEYIEPTHSLDTMDTNEALPEHLGQNSFAHTTDNPYSINIGEVMVKQEASSYEFLNSMEEENSFHQESTQDYEGHKPREKKSYSKYSVEDRHRIVSASQNGEDWNALAKQLGVNKKTAWGWVYSGRVCKLHKGGNRPKILNSKQVDVLISWVEENYTMTFKEMTSKAVEYFNVQISNTSIGNYLHGRLYTRKSLKMDSAIVNNDANKLERCECANRLRTLLETGKHIIWIDETNLNLFCRNYKGRPNFTPPNTVPHVMPYNAPVTGTNIIGAITSMGVLTMHRQRASFKAADHTTWLQLVVDLCTQTGYATNQLAIVFGYNAAFASIQEAVSEYTRGLTETICIPAYSPMLNPFEHVWTKMKSNIKSNLDQTNTEIRENITEQRVQLLEQLIDEAKVTITADDCSSAIELCKTLHDDAVAMRDMQFGGNE